MNGEDARPTWRRLLTKGRKIVYIFIVVLVIIFLVRLGADPWLVIAQNGSVFWGVLIFSAIGVFIQSGAYSASTPTGCFTARFEILLQIWSISAVISVIAPFFAGVASRTALLVEQGVPIQSCVLASGRQVWFGLEMSFLVGGGALFFSAWPSAQFFAVLSLGIWVVMIATRKLFYRGKRGRARKKSWLLPRLEALSEGLKPVSHLWFLFQIICMGVIYYVGFNGFGATLSVPQALALACITIVVSLIVFVPNGLGVTDALWVFIATDSGLGIDHAAALAITFRMAHFLAAILLYLILRVSKFCFKELGNEKSTYQKK